MAVKTYLVSWEIEIDAESPQAAAKQAFQIQQHPETKATVFVVQEFETSEQVTLDARE